MTLTFNALITKVNNDLNMAETNFSWLNEVGIQTEDLYTNVEATILAYGELYYNNELFQKNIAENREWIDRLDSLYGEYRAKIYAWSRTEACSNLPSLFIMNQDDQGLITLDVSLIDFGAKGNKIALNEFLKRTEFNIVDIQYSHVPEENSRRISSKFGLKVKKLLDSNKKLHDWLADLDSTVSGEVLHIHHIPQTAYKKELFIAAIERHAHKFSSLEFKDMADTSDETLEFIQTYFAEVKNISEELKHSTENISSVVSTRAEENKTRFLNEQEHFSDRIIRVALNQINERTGMAVTTKSSYFAELHAEFAKIYNSSNKNNPQAYIDVLSQWEKQHLLTMATFENTSAIAHAAHAVKQGVRRMSISDASSDYTRSVQKICKIKNILDDALESTDASIATSTQSFSDELLPNEEFYKIMSKLANYRAKLNEDLTKSRNLWKIELIDNFTERLLVLPNRTAEAIFEALNQWDEWKETKPGPEKTTGFLKVILSAAKKPTFDAIIPEIEEVLKPFLNTNEKISDLTSDTGLSSAFVNQTR